MHMMLECRGHATEGRTASLGRGFLSLLRFNICTFSFLVVTIPQPNCVGRVCHLEKWFPPRGAHMTLTAQQDSSLQLLL
jgi:hypothetical protein